MQEKIDKLMSFLVLAKKRSKRLFATLFNLYLNVNYTKNTSPKINRPGHNIRMY